MSNFRDPVDPPEGGLSVKAGELLGQFCIFRKVGEYIYPAATKEFTDKATGKKETKDMPEQRTIECDVWVFDRSGFAETPPTTAANPSGTKVRIGWWKAVKQLDDHEADGGGFLVGVPRKESDTNAIFISRLDPKGTARDVAEGLCAEILEADKTRPAPAPEGVSRPSDEAGGGEFEVYGEEPF